MVTTELNRHPYASLRAVLWCTTALWTITIAAAALGGIDHGLALRSAPHPTLRPTLDAWLSILANNARTLAVPLLLPAIGLQHRPIARRVGDIAVLAVLLVNGTLVGLELGRWQTQLMPYLPQLPVEWLAAGTATAAWTTARRTPGTETDRIAVSRAAAATAVLLALAAALEVLFTPHAGAPRG